METFRLHDEVKEWAFSIEMPTTAVTGHPYLTHVSTLALFNKTVSGTLVRVRQIKAERLMAQTTVTAVGTNIALKRITAHTVSRAQTRRGRWGRSRRGWACLIFTTL